MYHEGLGEPEHSLGHDGCVREQDWQLAPPNVPYSMCKVYGLSTATCAAIGPNPEVLEAPGLRPRRQKVKEGNECAPVH